jgi:cell division septal protein FtsQ
MARRPALVLARPDFGRRPVRLPARRAAALCAAAGVLVALGYVGARTTPVFAVRHIEVVGGTPRARGAVRRTLERLSGRSLVAIDAGAVASEVARLPSIRSASVDRAFPHDLRVVVAVERPIAVVKAGGETWLVSTHGRVIRAAGLRRLQSMPTIRLGADAHYRPGATLRDAGVRQALAALAALPRNFPIRVRAARGQNGEITLFLVSGCQVRLGRPDALGEKLRVAGRILATMPADERSSLSYLDVSVLERPVSA